MKGVAVALGLLLAACGSKGKPSDRQPMRGTDRVPSVSSAEVLAAEGTAPPPLLVIVEADGTFYLGAADTWDQLTSTDPLSTARSGRQAHIERAAHDAFLDKVEPALAVAGFADNELAPRPPPQEVDDGPPPPEAESPDDGAAESGGTGTMVTLDEGRMGRKEAPQRSAFASLEDLAAHQRGATFYEPGWRLSLDRLALVRGEVARGGHVGARQRALVLAPPTASASVLISAVAGTEGLIAVHHSGRVRPLRLEFLDNHGGGILFEPDWIELRVGAHDVAIEVPPGEPIVLADAHPETLMAALRAVRADANRYQDLSPIDVLVDRTVSAQRLVDVLVALDLAGERAISLGDAPEPGSVQATMRGHTELTLSYGQPNAQGDLPKAIIRRYLKHRRPQILRCYQNVLHGNWSVSGTVSTQFFIAPDGTVKGASASGAHPGLADCIRDVIATIEFPKPQGGGGVMVNYPFTLRR